MLKHQICGDISRVMVIKGCDEVCGKKRGVRSNGDTWWWNEDVKETVLRKKDAHNVMCQNKTEENKRRHKSMKNKAKKAVYKKTNSKEVEGGRCMRGSDGKLCFSEKERGKVWKDYMERTMNEVMFVIIMRRKCSRRSRSLCK